MSVSIVIFLIAVVIVYVSVVYAIINISEELKRRASAFERMYKESGKDDRVL